MTAKAQRAVSIGVGAIGLALVVMMITTEGELGALPLALILIGVIGYLIGRVRERSFRPTMILCGPRPESSRAESVGLNDWLGRGKLVTAAAPLVPV